MSTHVLVNASGDEKFESFDTNEYLIRSNTFAQMVKLATDAGFLKEHYGDLYADAMWVMIYLDNEHREFFWGVRPTGTSISFDRDIVATWNVRAYRFTVKDDHGKWTVDVEQIEGNPDA